MRLLNRLSDIVSANLNELVERYEDPELLLKQAVREMDESIRVALEHAVKVVAHEKILARQLADQESAITLWRQRAEAAVQRGEDQAAREALRHKRGHEAVCGSLAKQLEEATRAGQSLRKQIAALRLRTEEARRKLVLLAARQRAAQARQRLLREFNAVPIGGDAFQKFERMCRKVERTEAEADALAELTGNDCAVAELCTSEVGTGDKDIEAELAALKGQCGA
jgi:phage shock protein A